MYAVIRTGGKQYTVRPGATLDVEKLDGDVGTAIELTDVLMVADGDAVTVGTPSVAGAKVVAEVVEQGKHKKVVVFKYKPKIRYRKRTGHRQQFTRLSVKEIVAK
ncbi:MAG: 50S ribosomal protein L21 [Dehalococcoidia bacterium]